MHITFDTLEMVRRLEAKGFKREQAEEVISVVKDVQNELATKSDIENLQKDIESFKKDTKADIENLRKDTKADIENLQKNIESLKKETKADIKHLEVRLTLKFGTMLFGMLLAFKVLDKFL